MNNIITFFKSFFLQSKPSPQKISENFYYLALFTNNNIVYGKSIHGLWPNFANGSYPSFCKKVEFDFNKLDNIITELKSYWETPNDVNKEEKHFWEHEWKKHGSCMFVELTELEYFTKVLELYKNLMESNTNLEKYKKGNKYMIPFDLNFKLIEK